jgi:hypothetical protein
MSTERAAESDEPEHSVADLEGRDVTADSLDSSRKLVPNDRPPWPDEPGEESREEGFTRPEAAIRPVHSRCVNLDEQLVSSAAGFLTSDIWTISGGPYLV